MCCCHGPVQRHHTAREICVRQVFHDPVPSLTKRRQTSPPQDAIIYPGSRAGLLATWTCHETHRLLHTTGRLGRGNNSECRELSPICPVAENTSQGVSATPRGALVVARAGFQQCELVHIRASSASKPGACKDLLTAGDVHLWSVATFSFPLSYTGTARQTNTNCFGSPSRIGLRLPCSASTSRRATPPDSPTHSESQ